MSFSLRPFGKDEAAEAARLGITAYADNPFRKILFPNGMGQATYEKIYNGYIEAADDPDSHLLQLYDTETKKMAAYAVWRWTRPVSDEEWKSKMEERYDAYPDARQEVLRPFLTKEMTAKQKIMGNARWWELVALSVDIEFQRKGLGARLVEWGTDELEKRRLPGFIVASEAGHGLYVKHGFTPVESWDQDLEPWGGKGIYKNTLLTKYPKETMENTT